jgi:hypothetical protein
MPVIPPTVLKKLYVEGSLRLEDQGFAFDLKNLIAPATITEISGLDVDGEAIDDSVVTIVPPSGNSRSADRISSGRPLHFPVGLVVTLHAAAEPLEPGEHELTLHVKVKEIGSLEIPITDTIR